MRRGFTLVELLVVVGMIAVIMGAITTSISGARARARVVKATADVKEMTNAILAYENYSVGGEHRIPTMDEDANDKKLAFILGKGPAADNGEPVPVLYNAAIAADGMIRDPWGTPYRVKIEETTQDEVESDVGNSTFLTGYALPNFNRLKEGERP